MQPLVLIVVLLAAAAGTLGTVVRRRRSLAGLRALAVRRRLHFSPIDLIGLHERYYNLAMMRRGHGRHLWNVIYGATEAGLIAVFRHSFEEGFGVERCRRHWWVAVVEMPQVQRPWRIGPTGSGEGDVSTARDAIPSSGATGYHAHVQDFLLEATHRRTLEHLADLHVPEVLRPVGEVSGEVCGRLIALAVLADEEDMTAPEQLLAAVCNVARILNRATAS